MSEDNIVFAADCPLFAIGDISFRMANGWQAQLDMLEDITPQEVAHLSVLLFTGLVSTLGNYDYAGYIHEHNLHRHFKITAGKKDGHEV